MTSSNNSTLVESNSTGCKYDLSLNDYVYANNVALAVVHVPFAVFAAASNAIIVLTVTTSSVLMSPPNVLICSLACGDFLVGLLAQPLLIVMLLQHNAQVSCATYSRTAAVYLWLLPLIVCGSFVQVCVMCWDRYKAVSSPMRYRTTTTIGKMVKIAAASWLGWFAYIFIVKAIPKGPQQGIPAALALASFIVVCVGTQTAAFKAILRQNNQIAASATADVLTREKKLLETVRWILASIVLGTLPQLLFSISFIALRTSQGRAQIYASPWAKFAMCASSSLNPMIYFWRHENTRKAAFRLIGR